MTQKSSSLASSGMKCHPSQTSWTHYATTHLGCQVKGKICGTIPESKAVIFFLFSTVTLTRIQLRQKQASYDIESNYYSYIIFIIFFKQKSEVSFISGDRIQE